ncbi:LysM peptidoglycan-binding domain-containing protein [Streptomyces sp. NPDC017056]|uniref:LysM peptidoglycan-binding domain-containing protein n=1 Tax=Streptomyces sp. NPDC017056 TaxID=3364973 RepID=UPI0037994860
MAKPYKVKRGDSLYRIAQAHNIRSWRALYRVNHRTVGSNPHLIHPGQVLSLPR